MRGDQLARQWRVIPAIEASSNGLTLAEIAKREETGIRTIYRDLEAEHVQAHAKAQRAPRKTSRVLSAFLEIFLLPSYFLKERIKEFSVISIYVFWSVTCREAIIAFILTVTFAPFAPWREGIG